MAAEPLRFAQAVPSFARPTDRRSADISTLMLDNHLLAALPTAVQDQLLPYLQQIDLRMGDVLHDAGGAALHAYFPLNAVVSLLCLTEEGASTEVAVVGREGAIGVWQLLGTSGNAGRAVVQSPGLALRADLQAIRAEFDVGSALQGVLIRYAQGLMQQTAQSAACNRHHSIDRQLAKRLLMGLDRQQSTELAMTQESIGAMLGVRREGVTAGALKLQRAGIIRYSRGRISVLDRPALERQACECYAAAKKEFERLRLNDK